MRGRMLRGRYSTEIRGLALGHIPIPIKKQINKPPYKISYKKKLQLTSKDKEITFPSIVSEIKYINTLNTTATFLNKVD